MTIPVVGGPAAELFQQVVQPPLEKRRIAWMANVAKNCENWKLMALPSKSSKGTNSSFLMIQIG
jgi:hypothetical protein